MLEELRNLGVEVDKILGTLNGKQSLYERLIFKFYDLVKKSNITEDNLEEIYERVHALKGAAGNLGITPLFNEYVKILTLIREDKMNEVPNAIKEMIPVQEKILNCIAVYKK